jgi:large subunit ribosomal protein L23
MISIIKRPIVTEKGLKYTANRQYVFDVDPRANKIEIRRAIEKMFDVNVVSIRTANVKGKIKTRFTKSGIMRGRTPLKKKAFVTLKEGQAIDVVSGTATS